MIKGVGFFKRKPALSVEEFHPPPCPNMRPRADEQNFVALGPAPVLIANEYVILG